MTVEELLQRFCVHVERGIQAGVPLDGLNNRFGYIPGFVPVRFEPLLKLADLACALHLDVEFDVLGEPRPREVARTNQCLRAHDLELGMSDIRLRVKLGPVVNPALDLPALQAIQNCRHAVEERIVLLVGFDALIEHLHCPLAYLLQKDLACAVAGLRSHQQANLPEALPLPVQGEQGSDLEKSSCDIEGAGDLRPLFEVAQPGPARNAVVDDEQGAARGVRCHCSQPFSLGPFSGPRTSLTPGMATYGTKYPLSERQHLHLIRQHH